MSLSESKISISESVNDVLVILRPPTNEPKVSNSESVAAIVSNGVHGSVRSEVENSARLKSAVLNALVMVSIEGPDNEAVD
ncbi:hypothetical protein DPMN_143447 [Dreissena polymorpha]|uniref:Uncharacterized protein n=1 Tax=Dreissena polymorpha TaxID=45954 RepID=A0A9D4GD30_DREPO|nr:hypothetical protein DPMN_143447 [Dreissena polymorpha]